MNLSSRREQLRSLVRRSSAGNLARQPPTTSTPAFTDSAPAPQSILQAKHEFVSDRSAVPSEPDWDSPVPDVEELTNWWGWPADREPQAGPINDASHPEKQSEEADMSECTAAAFLIGAVLLGPIGGLAVLNVDAVFRKFRRWRNQRAHRTR